MKNKLAKLIILSAVLVFGLSISSCSSKEIMIEGKDAKFYSWQTLYNNDYTSHGKSIIIQSTEDLNKFISETDTYANYDKEKIKKYDSVFFETNALIAFSFGESKIGKTSEIDYYKIKDAKLEINLNSIDIENGNLDTLAISLYLLELPREQLSENMDIEILENGAVKPPVNIPELENEATNSENLTLLAADGSNYGKINGAAKLIKSLEELNAFVTGMEISDSKFQSYDKEFFKNEALVIFSFFTDGFENDNIVKTYSIKGNKLSIKVEKPDIAWGVAQHLTFALEIDKKYSNSFAEIEIIKNGENITGEFAQVSEFQELVLNEAEQALVKSIYYEKHLRPAGSSQTADDVEILHCLGKYGDAYVIMAQDNSSMGVVPCQYMIGNLRFVFHDFVKLGVYADNTYYTLDEAYGANILSYENLKTVNNCYRYFISQYQ